VLYSKKCSVYIPIFMAVSIRTAVLLLYALAKKSAFNFYSCFYKDSKCCIAKNVVYIPIFMAVSIKDSKCYCYML
jgi:hypothetical protein